MGDPYYYWCVAGAGMVIVLTLRAPSHAGGGCGSDTGPDGFDGEAHSALSPAFAGLECSDYPNLDKCPVYGGAETPRPSAYQVPPGAVRHAHNYHVSYHYHY